MPRQGGLATLHFWQNRHFGSCSSSSICLCLLFLLVYQCSFFVQQVEGKGGDKDSRAETYGLDGYFDGSLRRKSLLCGGHGVSVGAGMVGGSSWGFQLLSTFLRRLDSSRLAALSLLNPVRPDLALFPPRASQSPSIDDC